MKPLCIDLFCGLGGWADGFLAEGYDVVGFDVDWQPYHGHLILQDVRTIHGSQFKDAAIIVASPPCHEYSYMAMPWTRARAKAEKIRHSPVLWHRLTDLFRQCWRIQREASITSGRSVPLIVENVRGAQPWVGRSDWNYGSFHLWGDVPALMPMPTSRSKNTGGSWFAVAHTTIKSNNPSRFRNDPRDMRGCTMGGGWWHDVGNNIIRKASSRSEARKNASAEIAKIPFPLAQYIARCFKSYETR